jgi:pre-mRNA-splicing factor SPF27
MDTLRYSLPAPSSPATDAEWKAALDNANAQLQHQRIRYARYSPIRTTTNVVNISQQNLALLQKYGSNAWRIQNHLLEATVKQAEKALEELTELTVEVNRERKNMQVCKKATRCLSSHADALSAGSSW